MNRGYTAGTGNAITFTTGLNTTTAVTTVNYDLGMTNIATFPQGGGVWVGNRPIVETPHATVMRNAERAVRRARDALGPYATEEQVEEWAVNFMSLKEKEPAAPPIAPEDGVDQKMVDAAIKGVTNLINATLKSKSPGKFAEAARLCQIGQQLMRTQAKSVKDFAHLEADQGADLNEDAYGMQAPRERFLHRLNAAAEGTAEGRRERLALEPVAQVERERMAAEIANHEAAELDRLTALRERLPEAQRAAIDARVQTLVTSLETRNHAQLQMVPADVSRGHAAGEGGAEGDDAPGVRVDPAGGAGLNGAAHPRPQEGPGPQAVGL